MSGGGGFESLDWRCAVDIFWLAGAHLALRAVSRSWRALYDEHVLEVAHTWRGAHGYVYVRITRFCCVLNALSDLGRLSTPHFARLVMFELFLTTKADCVWHDRRSRITLSDVEQVSGGLTLECSNLDHYARAYSSDLRALIEFFGDRFTMNAWRHRVGLTWSRLMRLSTRLMIDLTGPPASFDEFTFKDTRQRVRVLALSTRRDLMMPTSLGALRELTFYECPALEDSHIERLAAIATTTLDTLTLARCDRLSTLLPLASLRLSRFALISCSSVRELSPVAHIAELAFHDVPELVDVKSFAGARVFYVWGARRLVDVSALALVEDLSFLNCCSLPLAQVHALSAVTRIDIAYSHQLAPLLGLLPSVYDSRRAPFLHRHYARSESGRGTRYWAPNNKQQF